MKTPSFAAAGLLLLSSVTACSLDVGPQSREVFKAEMRSIIDPPITFCAPPAQPPCPSSAALAVITIEDGRIFYDLYLANVQGAKSATLHLGIETSNTPAISTLWTTADAAGLSGTGYIVQQDRLDAGEVTGATYQQVVDAIRGGTAYVLMTTVDHPTGAFRAQVVPAA